MDDSIKFDWSGVEWITVVGYIAAISKDLMVL
jgi:hypothetical protein